MSTRFRRFLIGATVLLAACGAPDPERGEPEAAPEGRAETRSIRNTEAVGYSGDAIADQVDGALDASEKRKEQTDREAEEQAQ